MKFRVALISIALLSTPALADPAPANSPERKLTIFEGDACPADTICVVAPNSERYRIPKQFRQGPASLENQSWTVRSQDTLELGKSGINSSRRSGLDRLLPESP
jgi:hypothetical protein